MLLLPLRAVQCISKSDIETDALPTHTLSGKFFDKRMWFEAVAAKQEGCKTEEEHANYLAYKFSVLGKLIASSDPFLRIEPCKIG